jgi:hypothetical protein
MYKKIDLYFNGQYISSTNQSKTCKEAKEKYLKRIKDSIENENLIGTLKERYLTFLATPEKVKAFFDKTR